MNRDSNHKSLLALMTLSPAFIGLLGYIKHGFQSEADFGFASLAIIVLLFTVWKITPRWSIFVAVLSSLLWTVGELISDPGHAKDVVVWANLAIRTTLFVFTAHVVSKTRTQYDVDVNKAYVDELTNLYNRRYLFETVAPWLQQCNQDKPVAVIYIDMDHFKQLNDTRGHDLGDQALRVAGKAMLSTVRKGDDVIRLGGDEFVIVLPDVREDVAERVAASIKDRVTEALQPYAPTVPSVGAVWFSKPLNIDVMLAAADQVMYDVKHTGAVRVMKV